MATLKICDWLKERLGKDDETFIVTVGEYEFEVGQKGRDALMKQLESENAPNTPQIIERVVAKDAPPPTLQAAPPGVQVQVDDDPFDSGPSSMPTPPQAAPQSEIRPEDIIEIPDDVRRPFKKPSKSQSERVIEDAKVFNEGTLPSLTMGASEQRDALRKLKEQEEVQNEIVRRKARRGIRVNFDNEYGGR